MLKMFDAEFNIIGEIRSLKKLNIVHKWHEISSCTFEIHRNTKYLNYLVEDTLIMLQNDPTLIFLIADMKYNENNSSWEFTALGASCLLNRRITEPPAGQDTDKYTSDPVETIMKSLVDKNAINPTNADRKILNFVNEPDTGRGGTVSVFETRYKVLSEELFNLSLASGAGWGVSLDIATKQLQFNVLIGRNLAYNTTGAPYVVFSPEFKNVSDQTYSKVTSNYKNVAYAAGQGEGAARNIEIIGAAAGQARREVFIDARDLSDDTVLANRGEDRLNEYQVIENFECDVIQSGRFQYGRDYLLGDIVSVRNRDINKTLDARIIEVEEDYDGNTRTIKPTFDNKTPTVFQVIKRELINIKGQVKS
jgi:hypothetical protein